MKRCRFIIFSSLLLLAGSAQATQNIAGNITSVLGMGSGAVLFFQSGDGRGGLPNCAAGNPGRWAVDATTPAGQNKLSIILTAKALHKGVQVYGTNTCSVWSDTETVDYIVMND